ncbi:MAG: M48 family metalloprotease [Planctomycetes bacterium]|nr:M48 family metalloprotease [Planctomycetota bacterium]
MSENQYKPKPAAHPALDGFRGRIKRIWKSPFYVLALAVVALFMVLLPVLYVAMIAGAGYATYFHATSDWTGLLQTGRAGRVMIYKMIFIYIMPLVVGCVLVVFMIKPLFARSGRRERRLSLVRSNDPLIFEFVDQVCTAVGAPRPKRIDVDWEINASAHFRRGWLSLFLPSDLVLTLVAGLSLNEFAGVLAHEFGHFSQGLGMRLSMVIRSVNHWFVRVVYERDNWDDWLIETSKNDNRWVSSIFSLARLFVWLTRKLLWLLMVMGQAVSCVLLRQMEYDADRHEVRLVGVDAFESTFDRMAELSLAGQAIDAEMAESWKDGKLPDNYPLVVAAKSDDIPDALRKVLREARSEQRTGLFHTHPSSAARIRRGRSDNSEAVFDVPGSPAELFSQFDGLCKSVTMFYYQGLIGPSITPANLMPTEAIFERRKQAKRGRQAAERIYCGAISALRPVRIDPYSKYLSDESEANIRRIKRAQAALGKNRPMIKKLYAQYAEATETLCAVRSIDAFVVAGVKIDPGVLNLKSETMAQVSEEKASAKRSLHEAELQIVKIEDVVKVRLEAAIGLLSSDAITGRVKGWERLKARSQTLLEVLAVFDHSRSTLTELRNEQLTLRVMINLLADDFESWSERLLSPAQRIAIKQHGTLSDLRSTLSNHTYPFSHADGRRSLAEYAIGKLPARDEIGDIGVIGDQTLDHLESLYHRVMGELAQVAEGAESAVGLTVPSKKTTLGQDAASK